MSDSRMGGCGRKMTGAGRGRRGVAVERLEGRLMLCADHALPSPAALGMGPASGVSRSTPVRLAADTAASVMSDEVLAGVAPAVPALNSRPGAPKTVFLDFDGDGHRRWGSFLGLGISGGIDTLGPIPTYDTDGDTSTFSAHEVVNILDI